MSSINKSRIAKNTLLLYFRMLLIMCISLYTTRIVLRTLGQEDYGILTVVGGLVILLSFINNTMANASQRFFALELGRENHVKLKQTFCLNLNLYILFAIILVIIAETAGLWFLNTQMNIPPSRASAANWVYQFSVLSTIITIITIPFNAVIIAREKMNFYAYISIIEAGLKLAIVYILVYGSFDKLKLYAVLLFLVTVITSVIYIIYCLRRFPECHYRYYWDKALFKEMFSYSGWNMYGMFAISMNNHGINVILNIFFGPIINAARGVAYQIFNALNQFSNNFFTAVRPQITKSYATGEHKDMLELVFQSSKFSYYLLMILSIPILLEAPVLLQLWLTEVPDYTILFSRLVVINALVDSLRLPLMTSVQATGRVKYFELITGSITLINLPLSYFCLRAGAPPQITMYLSILFSFFAQGARILFVKKLLNMSIRIYINRVILPITGVSAVSFLIPAFFSYFLPATVPYFILIILISLISSLAAIYLTGLTKNEKKTIKLKLEEQRKKIKSNQKKGNNKR